ncbi:MAG: hypothetical protein M3141_01550, partial [Actinomycetota bacterium]|nr:hypothetical protein [Actinomycetota bacterium]
MSFRTEGNPVGEPSGAELAAAVARRLRRAGLIANATGAIDAFLFLLFLVPISGPTTGRASTVIALNAAVGALFLAWTLWFAARWGQREYVARTAWLHTERRATEEERDELLRYPVTAAGISVAMWVLAALTFTSLNAFLLPARAVAVSCVTLLLAGMTTAAITYLLAERNLRPVTARALAFGLPERSGLP